MTVGAKMGQRRSKHSSGAYSYRRFDPTANFKKYWAKHLKYLPGLALLVLMLLLSTKDAFYFNNGAGGIDWKIGTPQVNLWTAHSSRPLPELRSFALNLVNRDRQLNGLLPLVEDPLLSQLAQLHAKDMMKRNYYAHVTPEGRTPTDRFAVIGGQGGVGENIMLLSGSLGTGATLNLGTIESFQKSWMYSDGHRANLLKPEYTRLGYGIVSDLVQGKVYAVQNFQ
jgi:uncharacterized protein YkwD